MKNSSRNKGKRKMWIIIAIVLCIIIVGCFILPPSLGKIKLFLDDAGNVIDGSISEKIYVDINGISLGMFIMAEDASKPVLLFLGGGPGIPEYLYNNFRMTSASSFFPYNNLPVNFFFEFPDMRDDPNKAIAL